MEVVKAPTGSSTSGPKAATAAAASSPRDARGRRRPRRLAHRRVSPRRAGTARATARPTRSRRGPGRRGTRSAGMRVVGAKEHNLRDLSARPAARQVHRLHRPLRLGQVDARLRHPLRRGPAALPRQPVDLRAPVREGHGAAGRRPAGRPARRRSPSSSACRRGGRKSTVATVTEVCHYLRLLYAKIGVQHCPQCGEPLRAQTRRQIVDRIRREFARRAAHPAGAGGARPQGQLQGGPVRRAQARLRGGAHRRQARGAREGRPAGPLQGARHRHRRRQRPRRRAAAALADELTRALRLGSGTVVVAAARASGSTASACTAPACGIGYEALDPRLFSFNSRQGACPDCAGSGVRVEPDLAALLVPDRTLAGGGLAAFEDPAPPEREAPLLQALRSGTRAAAIVRSSG